MDVERLLEKYYSDIKHVETERHWFLGAYAVVIAGVLAFLAQDDNASHRAMGFGILAVLSFLGWVQAMRAAWILRILQDETTDIAAKWTKEDPLLTDLRWRLKWTWPTSRSQHHDGGTNCWFFRILKHPIRILNWVPLLTQFWLFSPLIVWLYLGAIGVFAF